MDLKALLLSYKYGKNPLPPLRNEHTEVSQFVAVANAWNERDKEAKRVADLVSGYPIVSALLRK